MPTFSLPGPRHIRQQAFDAENDHAFRLLFRGVRFQDRTAWSAILRYPRARFRGTRLISAHQMNSHLAANLGSQPATETKSQGAIPPATASDVPLAFRQLG
jgi:hypothetical protein